MKRFIEHFKAWRRGEEIEINIQLSLPTLLLIAAIIVFMLIRIFF